MRSRWIRTLLIVVALCWPLSANAVQFGAGSGSSYPTALDTINTRANKSGGACSSATASNICAEFTNDLQGAIRAIQLELGTLPKGSFADVATRLNTGLQTPWTTNINAAGYTLYGSVSASGNLTLDSTSNGTKGYVLLNPSGGKVGIGMTNPSATLGIQGSIGVSGNLLGTSNTWTGAQTISGAGTQLTVSTTGAAGGMLLTNSSTGGGGVLDLRSTDTGGTTWRIQYLGNVASRVGNLEISDFIAGVYGLVLTKGNPVQAGIGMVPTVQFELSGSVGQKASGTTWSNPSDRRLKDHITPFTDGLDVLKKIHPVSYQLNGLAGTPKGQKGISIIAQEMLPVAPYTIETYKAKLHPEDAEMTELYRFEASALTFVLINSVKELDARVKAVEAHASH